MVLNVRKGTQFFKLNQEPVRELFGGMLVFGFAFVFKNMAGNPLENELRG